MQFYSLNKQSPLVNFREATILGQAPDKGLYFPESIPVLDEHFFEKLHLYTNEAIAFKVMQPYVGDTIPTAELERIIGETLCFDIPVKSITSTIYALELFHGPTLAFKDVGARFMSRCLGYFLKDNPQKVTVLVATSGDTGGAVANGFYNVPGVDVIVLYPANKVSKVQEAQITTLGNNIHALQVNGTFDDCQHMVKQAFADVDVRNHLFLTSANSINVARWLPQQLYYFLAHKQWSRIASQPPIISVPSGNFGNICAAVIAHKSGLPVQHFVAACNANKVIPNFFETGELLSKPAVATLSNAMDIGNPSNFIRILQMFNHEAKALHEVMSSYSISDAETLNTLQQVYDSTGYLLDPHGAVAYAALQLELQKQLNGKGYIVETAHPVKFNPTIVQALGKDILAEQEAALSVSGKQFITNMNASYGDLKEFLMSQ